MIPGPPGPGDLSRRQPAGATADLRGAHPRRRRQRSRRQPAESEMGAGPFAGNRAALVAEIRCRRRQPPGHRLQFDDRHQGVERAPSHQRPALVYHRAQQSSSRTTSISRAKRGKPPTTTGCRTLISATPSAASSTWFCWTSRQLPCRGQWRHDPGAPAGVQPAPARERDPNSGESGRLDYAATLTDPAGIQPAWQACDGGFYYATDDGKVHMLRGAGSQK